MTSGRAGKVLPLDYIPLLRGDSASGRFVASFDLAEMPKPLMNACMVKVMAWFVPKSAHPQFSGYDEFMHSYQGKTIRALGQPDRAPPPFFAQFPDTTTLNNFKGGKFAKTMGLHLQNTFAQGHNADLVDAYNLIWNFRAASHSSRIDLRPFVGEDANNAMTLARAFWGSNPMRHIVPDYERALLLGNLDLDVQAGQIPISGLSFVGGDDYANRNANMAATAGIVSINGGGASVNIDMDDLYAQMGGETVGVTLADIDKARVAQAMARLRASMAGNDITGYDADDVAVAELMQGFKVPEEFFRRPWLLDSKTTMFGMSERHATDGANLDASVSKGRAAVELNLNVPAQDTGGVILITAEIVPEQLFERQGDPWLYIDNVSEFPDALRDIQRPEPVDLVPNWRIDAAHTTPSGLYGYEPMNAKWDRQFTRLGGVFKQDDPLNPFVESRSGIWQANVVDPVFDANHYLCPAELPHTVFSDTLADAAEIAFRHNVVVRGLTQIGDVLIEANDDFATVTAE